MEIRNGGEALKTLLGVSSTVSANKQSVRGQDLDGAQAAFAGDEARLSQAGAKVSDAASEDGIRMDRVAAVQHALAAGTCKVDAEKLADKLIDVMRAGGITPQK
jgi:negative regulator of flagellin synthesis FlgM